MNRFFLPAEYPVGGQIFFPPEVAHQIARVLRLTPGEKVLVIDPHGLESLVNLETVQPHQVSGLVESQTANMAEAPLDVYMYLCVSQREKFEWMLQKCTEVGAAGILPLVSSRSLVQSLPEVQRKYERWDKILQEASEQSERGRVPHLLPPLKLEDAFSLPEPDCLRLIAWEEEQSQTLTAFLHTLKAMPRAAAILIGPEGGFTPGEAQTAVQSGWHSVSLGRRILRMETAAVVAAALTIDYFENQPD